MERKTIKKMANEILADRRGHAAIITLLLGGIYLFCSFIFNRMNIPFISFMVVTLISTIYTISSTSFIIKLINRKNTVEFSELTPNTTSCWKFLVINLMFGVLIGICTLPFALIIVSSIFIGNIAAIILATLGFIGLSWIFGIFTVFIPFIVVENPEMSMGSIINEGFSMVFKNFGSVFIMALSLIPWYLLTLITFGLATLWVVPYSNTIFYVMYKRIKSEGIGFFNGGFEGNI